jgi:hypothetical protein
VGIWRYRDYKRYICLDKEAAERNIIVYAFRGNHDNPAFFTLNDDSSPILKRFWNKFTNFKVLPDFTILNVNGNKGIILGGAVSIDRPFRKSFVKGKRSSAKFYCNDDWWFGENLPDTNHIDEEVDFVLTHTGPRPPKIRPLNEDNCSFFILDPTLGDAVAKEEKRIDEIYEQFHPKKWWFGHFHINESFEYKCSKCCTVDILNLSPLQM